LKGGNDSRSFSVQPISSMLSSHISARTIESAPSKVFSDSENTNSSSDDETSLKRSGRREINSSCAPKAKRQMLINVDLAKSTPKSKKYQPVKV